MECPKSLEHIEMDLGVNIINKMAIIFEMVFTKRIYIPFWLVEGGSNITASL